ncbi:hypothetical protein CLOM_g23838 [Closterium sp. NIES-68]|nr:hypothetical protein CLOM_g13101 [Closterium sp. NIES-68]GJP39474.1 hypothetical protein CLOM_g23838 [Closterium sp. NIES-68]
MFLLPPVPLLGAQLELARCKLQHAVEASAPHRRRQKQQRRKQHKCRRLDQPPPPPHLLQSRLLVTFSDIHCHLAAVHRLRWRGEGGRGDSRAGGTRVEDSREAGVEKGEGSCLELASCSDDHSVRLFQINAHSV